MTQQNSKRRGLLQILLKRGKATCVDCLSLCARNSSEGKGLQLCISTVSNENTQLCGNIYLCYFRLFLSKHYTGSIQTDHCIRLSYFPISWKEAKVVSLPKPVRTPNSPKIYVRLVYCPRRAHILTKLF
jgi:hypothetical protein